MVLPPIIVAVMLGPGPRDGARFQLEESKGDQRPTKASPIVAGSIAGVSTLFVLDTGASTHTLASWLVKKAGLRTRQTELSLRDSVGRSVDVGVVDGVRVAIPGLGAFTLDAAVAELPAFFQDEGIGGVLSPQLLPSAGQALVLDMPASRVRLQEAAAARRGALTLPQSLTEQGLQGCAELAAPVSNLLFQVPTVVEGEELLLTLDTGAGRTAVHEASAAGAKLKPRALPRRGAAAVGGAHEASSVQAVSVKAGATEAVLEVDLVPPKGGGKTCRADGHLGMDVLKRCVLVLSRSAFAGGCQEPREVPSKP